MGKLYWVHNIRTGQHLRPSSVSHHIVLNQLKSKFTPIVSPFIKIVTNARVCSITMIFYVNYPWGRRVLYEHMMETTNDDITTEYHNRYAHQTFYFSHEDTATRYRVPTRFRSYDIVLLK